MAAEKPSNFMITFLGVQLSVTAMPPYYSGQHELLCFDLMYSR